MKRTYWIPAALILFCCASAAAQDEAAMPTPPEAPKQLRVDTVHGHVFEDNYYWMRSRGDSAVIAYLEAENAYTEAMTAKTDSLEEELFQELKGRIKETDLSVPARYMDYFYYSRTEEGQQYEIYCRKKGSLEAEEEVILNINTLAEGHDFYSVGAFEISPNQELLAFSFDTTGSETYTLVVKNLTNGAYFSDSIPGMSSAAWAADNKTIFYTTEDSTRRPDKLWRHVLGTEGVEDVLVYHETDPAYYLGITATRSREYLLLGVGSMITSEYRYLRTDDPTGEFRLIRPRQQGIEYTVNHQGDYFYINTNDNAVNFRLMQAPVDNPGYQNWEEVIPARDSVKIKGIDCFENHLVIYELARALPEVRIRNTTDDSEYYIEFPEPIYTVYPDRNPSYDAHKLRYNYQSMVTPSTIVQFDMNTKERETLKQKEVLGGFDPNDYVQERIWAPAGDGAMIPMSLVYRKGLKKNGSNPAYMYGYGAYGMNMEPWFSTNRISLLDRGFVYAVAHIRGGGMMGRPWYEDGKLLNKRNTFTDFIACGDYLVNEGYTTHEKMAISGGSAGGLLIGAVVNMRPDLAGVAVAEVPFVDIMNTMLDESIPLTVIEYEEWGNPNEREYFDYMLSYSPYDNVAVKDYPAMLITAGLNDPRVPYWEAAKWTAKLRDMKTGDDPILLKTNLGAGHMGASGRYDYLREVAFEFAFVLDQLGVVQ